MPKEGEGSGNITKSVRLPRKLDRQVADAAKRENRTQSAIIQTALEEYFGRKTSEPVLPEELVIALEEYLERHR